MSHHFRNGKPFEPPKGPVHGKFDIASIIFDKKKHTRRDNMKTNEKSDNVNKKENNESVSKMLQSELCHNKYKYNTIKTRHMNEKQKVELVQFSTTAFASFVASHNN